MTGILSIRFPEKAAEFFAYIAHAEWCYEGHCWAVYDRQFRRRVLNRRTSTGPSQTPHSTTRHLLEGPRLWPWHAVLFASGPGALMAKVDIESAYRIIPVHPQDRLLQGVFWDSRAYIDPMLPVCTKIFNAVADALARLAQREGVRLCYHYLDDYTLLGPPASHECQRALEIFTTLCDHLGVPLAGHKQERAPPCVWYSWASRLTQWRASHVCQHSSLPASKSSCRTGGRGKRALAGPGVHGRLT